MNSPRFFLITEFVALTAASALDRVATKVSGYALKVIFFFSAILVDRSFFLICHPFPFHLPSFLSFFSASLASFLLICHSFLFPSFLLFCHYFPFHWPYFLLISHSFLFHWPFFLVAMSFVCGGVCFVFICYYSLQCPIRPLVFSITCFSFITIFYLFAPPCGAAPFLLTTLFSFPSIDFFLDDI